MTSRALSRQQLTLKATTAASAESKRTFFFHVWKWTVQLKHITDACITCFCNGFGTWVTGSRRTLVAVLQKCAPGSSHSLLNSDQNKGDRLLDSLRDLFSNSPTEFLESFFFVSILKFSAVKTFLMLCESTVSHLTYFSYASQSNS